MSGRIETGALQFGDDWPGVFIRGDSAMGYWLALSTLLERLSVDGCGGQWDACDDLTIRAPLEHLAGILASCNVRSPLYTQPPVILNPIVGSPDSASHDDRDGP